MLKKLQESLSHLIGLHRQLLETLRQERDALVDANKSVIEECAFAKDACLQAIAQSEKDRAEIVAQLAVEWKRPISQMTLSYILTETEPSQPAQATALRSQLNALVVLVERVKEQNQYNGALIERALENIEAMKANVFQNEAPQTQTYNSQGSRAQAPSQSRLISQEA